MMMSLAGIDKGKRPFTETEKQSGEEMEPASIGEKVQTITEDVGASGVKQSQVVEGIYSCVSFTELLAQEANSYSGLEKMKEDSDGEKSRASVSISTKNDKRGSSQLPNLDLSLLPSRESFELLRTPRKSATHVNQWPPFSGFYTPCLGGVSPVNINAFSNQQQQQQSTQLTIFYGGTVSVYNVSADMAKAIMMLASSGVNTNTTSTVATPTSFCPATPAPIPAETICSTPLPTGRGGQMQPTFNLKAANLPISRKNSLQRFLEKRNVRIHARAPYANANNAPLGQN